MVIHFLQIQDFVEISTCYTTLFSHSNCIALAPIHGWRGERCCLFSVKRGMLVADVSGDVS